MITVYVKLFGRLQSHLPEIELGRAKPIQVPLDATIAQLAQQLKIPSGKLFFVNGVAQKDDFILSDQDNLAIIPPLGGG